MFSVCCTVFLQPVLVLPHLFIKHKYKLTKKVYITLFFYKKILKSSKTYTRQQNFHVTRNLSITLSFHFRYCYLRHRQFITGCPTRTCESCDSSTNCNFGFLSARTWQRNFIRSYVFIKINKGRSWGDKVLGELLGNKKGCE